ncbi:hypothetical protein A3B45_03720 [Candidatus Daviesbacteria bacterium RIFCSPLOWO2_01_FULL_39_12]|uniref:DUF5667 domain-containing protein n=1 Tax=Candidatus Daviesbacteria bacterium RIFCSPLOWO2_01_FULL_39_12 TaxID=1797785 RepID=A0A1F5KU41_9BACT|nr:MAG: hypothetical protein A3B45_03720 [Candidatus Daviesbacteria bacterium RIFCSPLOWO2_01_FULL_39_12]
MDKFLGINPKILTRAEIVLIAILALAAFSLILTRYVNPDFVPLFNLKRLQEKVFLNTKPSPESKVEYMTFLLNVRLDEIKYILSRKKYDYLLSTSLRYSTLAGETTELIIANNLKDQAEPLKNQFLYHKQILHDLYVSYPKNTDNVEYKYLEDDINYLDIYLNKLSRLK